MQNYCCVIFMVSRIVENAQANFERYTDVDWHN